MADLGNGTFVVIWRDDSGGSHDTNDNDSATGSGYDVRGQIFTTTATDDDGEPILPPQVLGGDFRIHDYTSGHQYQPSVTTLDNGGFVVTWRADSGHDGGSGAEIRAQMFDGTGTPVGD